MKKVLVVAYYFPPSAAVGSLRPLGFCRYLSQHGWLPRVLTTEPLCVDPSPGVDESLNNLIPKDIRVDRVPHGSPLRYLLEKRDVIRGMIKRFMWIRSIEAHRDYERSWLGGVPSNSLNGFKRTVADLLFSFPDPQCAWLRPAVRHFGELSRQEYPDVIFATGGPWTSLLVGRKLAELYKVPFVADFRDPWSGPSPYYQSPSPFLVRRSKKLEKSVYIAAARIVANTEELCHRIRAEHPEIADKCTVITNGFDTQQPSLSNDFGKTIEEFCLSSGGGKRIEFCHFGAVYGNRNPLSLFKAVAELLQDGEISHDQFQLRFVGKWEINDQSCENIARALEAKGVLKREPPVSHESCLQEMAKATVLLAVQTHCPLQVPAKIYEYVASGRPLLVIGGEGATSHLVERYGLGRCCENEVGLIKKVIGQFARGEIQISPRSPETLARFHYRALAGELAQVFNDVSLEKAKGHPQ